ncbi:hypothetical protein, partial [Kitasatospora cineracea]|uniref:hypothetical protein n=1 Tax=Kitasatospora cineracea TaxID=88074 RepID=UPI001ABF7B4B
MCEDDVCGTARPALARMYRGPPDLGGDGLRRAAADAGRRPARVAALPTSISGTNIAASQARILD